jgi:prepilin-type N-terminal cleavage/methylation domain-containing protein
MTTTTPHAKPRACRPGPRRAGFTLTELLIATSLSGIVLAGVLTTFLLIGRAGFNASAYADMSSALRNSLDQFHRDARLASDVRWHDSRRLTLLLPRPSGDTESVTYGYEPSSPDSVTGVFYREIVRENTPVRTILARDIASDFAFQRYRLGSASDLAPAAANDLETKLVEVNLRAVRRGANGSPVSQNAVSARCLLRNKSVAQ